MKYRALVSCLAVLSVLIAMPLTQSTSEAQATSLRWIINGPAVAYFAAEPSAQHVFAGTKPFVVQRAAGAVAVPDSWGSRPTRIFTSYASFEAALDAGKVGPEVKAVLYDPEGWRFTPPQEQRDLARYAKLFADLAHSHGLVVIVAPAVDLVRNLAPATEPRYAAYLRLRLAEAAAASADVFEIQAQGSEASADKYASFVRAAARQARDANPNIRIFAGLSTNPSGATVTARQILSAIEATRGDVDGYWFNVPAPSEYCPKCNRFRPELALDVLRQL